MEEKPYKVIKNLCYVEAAAGQKSRPAMVIHIAKKDDSLWSIAKQYVTTMDAIKEINSIDDAKIDSGRRLLIVR